MQLYVAKRFMKKTKVLTVAGVMLAMMLTGCKTGGKTSESKAPESTGNPTTQPTSKPSSTSTPAPSTSTPAPQPVVIPDPDGHHFGADADVAADAESGAVAYKKATCSDNDGFERLKINQSAVTYGQGSSRKNGTPDGYTKLDGNGQTMSFKFKTDKKYSGKLFLYGVMDGYSANLEKNFCYYQGSPNVEVKVNGQAIDISAQKDVKFQDIFGEEADPETDNLSPENYALLGNVTLEAGVNEIVYKRVATLNMLIKDFVFVVEEFSEWTPAEAVAAKGEGYVGYSKRTSRVDGATKIEIRALDGTFDQTTNPVSQNKNGTAEGYLKLDQNGNKISWKFDFAKAGFAQIYQIGFMDSFSSNTYKTYANVSSRDNTKTEKGNFELTVNENVVDKGPYMNISFEDLTADGDNTIFEASKNYSPVALIPIGTAALAAGDNTIVYERLGSYNFAMSKLVIYFYETAPVPAAEFETDGNAHWNEYAGLPKARFNYGEHVWVQDTTKQNHEATSCADENIAYEVCSVCGETREVKTPSTLDHVWEDKAAVKNSDDKDVIPMECSGCHHAGAKINENDYSEAQFDKDDDKVADAIRPSQGKAIKYKIVVSKAGTYSLEFSMFCKSNGNIALSQRKFAVKVNGADAVVDLDGTKTPDGLGMSTTVAVSLQLCSAITLVQGENTIELTCASYRLHYKGYMAVYEK